MTSIEGTATPAAGPGPTADAGLRQAARQLESVFVDQLFKAMRATVPHDGYLDGGSGEDMFTSMLDEQVAAAAPDRWRDGFVEAIVRQLGPGR